MQMPTGETNRVEERRVKQLALVDQATLTKENGGGQGAACAA